MKKLFVALMCMAAIAFTSCSSDPLVSGTKASNLTNEKVENMDNKTEKCWHVAEKYTEHGKTYTEDGYVWCTEQVVAYSVLKAYQAAKLVGYDELEIAYKEASAKTKEKCDELEKEAEKNRKE